MTIRTLTQIRKQKRSYELTETYHYLKNKIDLYEVDFETNITGKKCITRFEWYVDKINGKIRIYKFTIKELVDKDTIMEMVVYEEKYKEDYTI